ncbi:MAG: hypothetical protein Q8L09_04120 [Candidatus Moranbacteria bacterium]|nr:hypothetical protein [Candidatus Moranbacteria bacterium]
MTEIKKSKKIDRGKEILRKTSVFILRWLYLIFLLGVAAYAVWIWESFVYNADWSEEKKQEYIKEQAVFSFDEKSYRQVTDLIKLKKERLESDYKFTGKDIFYPEGF